MRTWVSLASPADGRCAGTPLSGRMAWCLCCCSGAECAANWKPSHLESGGTEWESTSVLYLLHNRRRYCGDLCVSVLPSSSAEMAKRGMMSRLWVLFITSGLALCSDWEELDEARGRRLPGKHSKHAGF